MKYAESYTYIIPVIEPSDYWKGEQLLWFAVFEAALERYTKLLRKKRLTKKQKQEVQELHSWFFSSDEQWIGSFLSICNNLQLSSALIRADIRNYLQFLVEEKEHGGKQHRKNVSNSHAKHMHD